MGQGNLNANIMLISEAPGYNEVVDRKPFVGKAGQLLRKNLEKVGINTKDVYITNVVKCRPPQNRTPKPNEIKACSEYLIEEIKKVKPKVIASLGNIPLKYLTGNSGVTKLRGSEIWSDEYNCWILPIYHPSYVVRFAGKAKQHGEFCSDLGKLNRLTDKKNSIEIKENYKIINNLTKLKKVIDLLLKQKEVSFDLETDKLEYFDNTILCATFSFKERTAIYVPIEDKRYWKTKEEIKTVFKELKRFFESNVKKIAQNGKFDNQHLLSKGIKVNNFYFDTMVASYLLDEEGLNHLSNLANIYTNMGNYKDELGDYIKGKKKIKIIEKVKAKKTLLGECYINKETYKNSTIWDAPLDKLVSYACKDADTTFRVYKKLKILLKEQNLDKLFYKILMPLIRVIEQMEFRGIKLDKEYLDKIASKFVLAIDKLESKIQEDKNIKKAKDKLELEKLNINSPIQLRTLLFDILNLAPVRKTKKGNVSTDNTTLEELTKKHRIKVLEDIQAYRKVCKFYSTYIKDYQKIAKEAKEAHTNYSLTRTRTGRLSSSKPNLQNIPKRDTEAKIIRKAILAREGYTLVECDYKQLEFRVFAHCVGCLKLIEMAGKEDIHRSMASKIFKISEDKISDKQRFLAKGAVFGGIMYGGGSNVLVSSFGISYNEAEKILNEFYYEFPKVKIYINNQIKFLKENQYVVNIFGRRRRLSDIYNSDEGKRNVAKRQAVNAVIQSSGADIVYIAMIKLFNKIDSEDCKMLLNIHDAVIFEIKDNLLDKKIKEIYTIMNNPLKLKVPLVVDVEYGKNLGEMKKYNI
jgi:DNA polymerase-1